MGLEPFGLNEQLQHMLEQQGLEQEEVGRVIVEHKERYVVQTEKGPVHAEITGNLRYAAESRLDFPAVGDWVQLMIYDEQSAVILKILPRLSILERQAVGKHGERQLIATNVDYAFIMQAVGHDFNLNRLERYLSICHAARITPIAILSKIDLISEEEVLELKQQLDHRHPELPLIVLSNETLEGLDEVKQQLQKGKTYCVLGSSGVGKSSLINNLLNKEQMKVSSISEQTSKGRHTTSHRELFVLDDGGVIIDTPGMRELGVTDKSQGLETTFSELAELAEQCKFNDCTHTNEAGCAILEALENGEIDEDALENFQKLKREQARFESSVREKRAKDKKLGKLYKNIQKEKQKRKF
jgi:ribosome biogenesis GTPase